MKGDDDFYQTEKKASEESEGDAGPETALLPKSLFQGKELEPGSTCKIKIESIMGDEVEVSYVKHEEKEEKKEEEDDAESSIDDGIERMRAM